MITKTGFVKGRGLRLVKKFGLGIRFRSTTNFQTRVKNKGDFGFGSELGFEPLDIRFNF